MSKTLRYGVICAALVIVIVLGTAVTLSDLRAIAPQPVPPANATNARPLSIDPAMLMTITSLPTALNDAITASLHSRTEIIAAQHTDKIPLEPMAPTIRNVWCITIYPEATITLYVQRYQVPADALFVQSGDFVPGAQQTGRIDHFFAIQRGEAWELYHPEVYHWTQLGCSNPAASPE